ncbi:MAG: tetratricopeptide repeat protein [Betaproteobacteria bacterium]|nr:tetratricopeptide repeat protein [Betaproteobacteria bacterium]
MRRALRWHIAGLLVVLAATVALYAPFLGNPLVFDDKLFFSGRLFAHYATHPLGLDLRLPAYFSLTMTEVIWGGVVAQRTVSLVLHAACALLLYRLLVNAQRLALPVSAETDVVARAALGAGAFALHPVAVYGAGYLVQRSIVMATLFSLACALLFLRGLRRRAYADALSAALGFSLAVLSKEHAVLLPAALLPLAALARPEPRFALRYVALFGAACAPAALFVVARSLRILGGVYEEAAGAVAAQIVAAGGGDALTPSLALSAVTQAGLFFKYLALWFWPDTGAMSIDLRVDFLAGWTPAWIAIKVAAFAACGAVGVWLVRRGGAAALAGGGLLFAWMLFFVEFTTVKLQEPFVLYRSYLWAPGYALMLVAALSPLRWRAVTALGIAACTFLAYAAHDRLTSFSDPLALWTDAVAKLPESRVPWGSRTLYGAGREYLYAGDHAKALAVTETCVRRYPQTAQCVYARGVVHLQMKSFEAARADLERAIEMLPKTGIQYHRLGLALECLGRFDEAKENYRLAERFGFRGGQMELQRLEALPQPPPRGKLAPACR